MATTEQAQAAAHDEDHAHHEHGDGSLNRLAVSATTHCMTGCVLGEVTGLAVATALGWSTVGQIALAVGLAYLFGFTLTSIPLFRAGLALGVIETVSVARAIGTIAPRASPARNSGIEVRVNPNR